MKTRRDFLKTSAGAALALAGCRMPAAERADAQAVEPPYANTVRDRLWMWGHGGVAFDAPRVTNNIPAGTVVEMNDACRDMGIPNVCVCRYAGLPKEEDCDAYLATFKDIRRIAFSVVDGADGTWRQKFELAKRLRKVHPKLGTVWLDDFFTPQSLSRPEDIHAFRRELDREGLRLATVLYPDQEGVKPEFKGLLDLCDQISVWTWHSKNIPAMKDDLRKVRDLVGPEKAILMGVYMWDFADEHAIPDELMHQQLATAHDVMFGGEVSGLLFHPTSIVRRPVRAVEIARKWIAENGECELS